MFQPKTQESTNLLQMKWENEDVFNIQTNAKRKPTV